MSLIQRSEGRSQRSAFRDQKGARVVDHAAKHLADFLRERSELSMYVKSDVSAVFGEIQRRIC
jgi:hypothetical protein